MDPYFLLADQCGEAMMLLEAAYFRPEQVASLDTRSPYFKQGMQVTMGDPKIEL